MSETQNQHSDVIARVFTKNQVLDFSNNLVPAFVEDYANLQGVGGSKHAASSGIKLGLTDKQSGNYVTAQLPTEVFERIGKVALDNIGEVSIHKGDTSRIGNLFAVPSAIYNLLRVMGEKEENGTGEKNIGERFKAAMASMAKATKEKNVFTFPTFKDYSYSQTRVNPYSKNGNLVQCSNVVIEHKQYRPDGSEAGYPWQVRVSNFWAEPNEHANGTLSYKSNTVQQEKKVALFVSNEDMHTVCYKIDHFVKVWEMAVCTGIVREGLKNRSELRRAIAEQKNQQT